MFHNGRSGSGKAASPAPGVAGLIMEFGDRWRIAYDIALSVWSAERRSPDGRSRWFICEREHAGLAVRLAAAEARQ